MQIGAQFYTVRNQCQTLDDFALTLRKVADIGYKTVQISGTCPYDAQWLKEQEEKGEEPPVFISANLDGGDAHNKKIMEKYKAHIFYM